MSNETKRKATMPAYQRNEAVARIARRYVAAVKVNQAKEAAEHEASGLYAAGNGRTLDGAAKAWAAALRKEGFRAP